MGEQEWEKPDKPIKDKIDDSQANDSNKVLRTLATGQSDITRHESLSEKKLVPKYTSYINPYIIIKYEYLEDVFKSIFQSNNINADKGSATIIGLSTDFTTEQTLIYKILLLTWTEKGIRKYTTLRNEAGILTSSGTESEDNTFTLHMYGLDSASDENIEETVKGWLNTHDEGLSIPNWDDLVDNINSYTDEYGDEARISFINLSYFQDVVKQIWLENNITWDDAEPVWIDSYRGYDPVQEQDLNRYAILARAELSGDYNQGGIYFMTMQDSELLLFCVTGTFIFNDGLYIDNQSAAMRPKEWILPGDDEMDFNDWINDHRAILITQQQAERLIAAANYNAVNNIGIENNI